DLLDQLLDRALVGEVAQDARLGVVQHRIEQGQRADPGVAALGEVGGGDRGQRATHAQAHNVDDLSAGDVADDVEGCRRAAQQVVVHRRATHVLGRVQVADGEDRAAVLYRPLDEAAAGRE